MSTYDGWEPGPGYVELTFGKPEQEQFKVFVVGADIIELRDDLTEALHDPQGFEAVEVTPETALPGDLVYVFGNPYRITNTLTAKQYADETEWIVQFSNGSFSSVETEVTLPSDQQFTAYRRRADHGEL